ncbi:MAG: MFS transporter [Acidobacteria bacterium]|nr:MFS transporter [Acidobacteriota bacterium]
MSGRPSRTSVGILIALSAAHLINDLLQSLLPAVYPMLKQALRLSFWQIGLITLSNQLTASLLQPLVGLYTDARPQPFLLAVGMGVTLGGIVLLAGAHQFAWLIVAAALVGVGSSVFHPESSRIARAASGGRHGLAQSLFQTGGNFGSSLGPLLAAFVVIPYGQGSISWFAAIALVGVIVLWRVGRWYAGSGAAVPAAHAAADHPARTLPRRDVQIALGILVVLVFSKFIYLTSLTSYYTFYLIQKFGVSVQSAQLHLFLFLGAVAAGTFLGGPIGDRVGRKVVIWISILGALPFSLLLPHVNLFWTGVLSAIVGLIMSSAFSAILVYAQELVPGRIGLIAGLFFGVAFGIGGLGAAALGWIADAAGIEFVYRLCAFLPALGLFTAWLPDVRTRPHAQPAMAAD